ncbi:hypothetical protein WNY37_15750 [Henriciella sp. AS95]|uniref:DUF2474 domain-containing protein n=1 Tax=Henriciella sp. AS95 TaxID=3135782 RepID=UPI003171683C
MIKGLLEPEGPDETGASQRPIGKRLLWFVGLAAASVIVVAVVAYALRGLLFLET